LKIEDQEILLQSKKKDSDEYLKTLLVSEKVGKMSKSLYDDLNPEPIDRQ
jgi:hypothetical protein